MKRSESSKMKGIKTYFICVLLIILSQELQAQVYVKGTVQDSVSKDRLIGAGVVLKLQKDTAQVFRGLTDALGNFTIPRVPAGIYLLTVRYLGYRSKTKQISLKIASEDLGVMDLLPESRRLNEVKVTTQLSLMNIKGDTVSYNAGHYKTYLNAEASELIKKLPGLNLEKGELKVNGEVVKHLLVDGKAYFGDIAQALKNLPAEMIDKVEIYKDTENRNLVAGNTDKEEKILNIVTKKDKRNGVFGKISTGIGSLGTYVGNGNLNWFGRKRRIALSGSSTNTGLESVSPGSFSNLEGQSGIIKSQIAAVNYNDQIGRTAIESFGSFVRQNNENGQHLQTDYLGNLAGQLYREDNSSSTVSKQVLASLQLRTLISGQNELLIGITPKLSNNLTDHLLRGERYDASGALTNGVHNSTHDAAREESVGFSAQYLHRFKKVGRTFTGFITGGFKQAKGSQELEGNTYDVSNAAQLIQQNTQHNSKDYNLNTSMFFAEPLWKHQSIGLKTELTVNNSRNEKQSIDLKPEGSDFSSIIPELSANYSSHLTTTDFETNYRLLMEKLKIQVKLKYQSTFLDNEQDVYRSVAVRKDFNNFVPTLLVKYIFTPRTILNFYSAQEVRLPDVLSLASGLDNSNPIFFTSGNPNLDQTISRVLNLNFSTSALKYGQSLTIDLGGDQTRGAVVQRTVLAVQDTVVDGILLKKGVTLSRPVNHDGQRRLNANMVYSVPLPWIKCNFELNSNFGYLRTPVSLNGTFSVSDSYQGMAKASLHSSISPELDFNLSQMVSFNKVVSSVSSSPDNFYNTYNTKASIVYSGFKGILLETDLSYKAYSGSGTGVGQKFMLWNAGIGRRFLAKKQAEIRLLAFDLLNQNRNVNHQVTGAFIQDSSGIAQKQFFMLTLSYYIKNYKADPG